MIALLVVVVIASTVGLIAAKVMNRIDRLERACRDNGIYPDRP